LFSRAAKNFGIGEQKQLKLSVCVQPRSENFWNWQPKHLKLTEFSSAAQRKISEPRTRALYFVRPPSENFGIHHQKQNCIFFFFCSAAKFFGIVNKSNSY
jgi:hypothetical protein